MFEMTHTIPFTKCDPEQKLKLHEAVSYMMDCCQFQEYQEVAFRNFLESNHLAVFLFSIQIDFFRRPTFRENVRTAVKIYGCKTICGLRRLTMRDEAGELCMIANATGAFFDTQAGRAIKLDPDNMPVQFDEAEPMECLPRKVPVPATGGTAGQPTVITPSQLDPNGHLTSHMYFAIASDAIPADLAFNRVRMEFKKQIKQGETVTPVVYPGAVCVVDLQNGDGESCAVAEFSTFQPVCN